MALHGFQCVSGVFFSVVFFFFPSSLSLWNIKEFNFFSETNGLGVLNEYGYAQFSVV